MPDDIEQKVDQLLTELRALRPRIRRIDVVSGDATKLIPTDDIVYFTMNEDGKRLSVFTQDKLEWFNFRSVSEIDDRLADDPRFMRVHKSFLVNLDFVTELLTVPGGRELHFAVLPDLTIKVAQSSVKDLEAYFGI